MSPAPKPAYQPDEASAKIAGAALLGVLALAVAATVISLVLLSVFASRLRRPPATPIERAAIAAPGPRLEADPRGDRLALEAKARAKLEGYRWTDQAKGLAHVPIERAMALQAEAGWPDAQAAKP